MVRAEKRFEVMRKGWEGPGEDVDGVGEDGAATGVGDGVVGGGVREEKEKEMGVSVQWIGTLPGRRVRMRMSWDVVRAV